MYIRFPKPTKADLIRYILASWDPCRKGEDADYMFYNYEAEVLAQGVRKNSRVESVAGKVKEVIDEKLRREGCGHTVDDENAFRVAETILNAVKRDGE